MACHAGFSRRDTGEIAFFNGGVTIKAVDTKLINMMTITEWYRLTHNMDFVKLILKKFIFYFRSDVNLFYDIQYILFTSIYINFTTNSRKREKGNS